MTQHSEPNIAHLIHQLVDLIHRHHPTLESVILIGILSNGAPIAERIAEQLLANTGISVPTGYLDITLFRDDLSLRGSFITIRESNIPCAIDKRCVILVDDVLCEGRTMRAALNALFEFGRPDSVELGVLIDRGHRKLPITPNYVGTHLNTKPDDHIRVHLYEIHGEDKMILERTTPIT